MDDAVLVRLTKAAHDLPPEDEGLLRAHPPDRS